MNGFRRGCLLLQVAVVLLFTILYPVTSGREGVAYGDEFFPKTVQGDAIVYTGKQNGHKTTYTVRETDRGYAVDCRIGDRTFGPYRIERISAFGLELGDWKDLATKGLEIWEGEELLFRGGYAPTTDFAILVDENGPNYNWGVVGGTFGHDFDRPVEPPSTYDLFHFTIGAAPTHRGDWLFYWLGLFIAVMNAVSILFADQIFLWHMSWRVQRPEDVEPSDWEIFSRYFGWCFLAVMAFGVFLYGLFAIA